MATIGKVVMLVENMPVPDDPRVWAEANALRDQGFKVSIICPKGTGSHREPYICIDNIHIYRYQPHGAGNKAASYLVEYSVALLKTFWLSIIVFFQQGFDVIHAANPPDLFFIIGLLYRLFGKKFVFDQHDLAPELFQAKFKDGKRVFYRLQLFLEWCCYRVADLVIETNLSQRRFAIERGHCCPERVFVVRNGPNLKYMKLGIPEPELKRGRRFLLAYLGVMGFQDGVEYALSALYDLVHKRGRYDVSLVLMGDGDKLPSLRVLAHELRLDDYVNFTGWITRADTIRYLTVADIGLVPDPLNGLNEYSTMIKTMEYMALGIPIVAFDLAETRFSAQDAALYATPNLVADFTDKVELLLDNEELRIRLGAIGSKRIDEELSWDHCRKNLSLVYEKLFPGSLDLSEISVSVTD